jgi:putative transposase
MRNHYHLLLSECTDGGLIKFLRKLNVGYAKYFNERYKRSGTLFQGRTKKILVDSDAYFLHILNYIHLNPLDFLINAQYWRERKIANTKEALAYLEGYKWSSYRDYAGLRNFPSILDTSLFMEVFNNDYTGQLERYIGDISLIEFQHLVLETSDT